MTNLSKEDSFVFDEATTRLGSESNRTPFRIPVRAHEGDGGDGGGDGDGSGGDGQGDGTQAGADSFATEREQLETRARTFQGTADREKARADKAEADLAALRAGGGGTGSGGGSQTATVDGEQLLDAFERRMEMREQRATLRTEFPLARPDLFEKLDGYASPEAFRTAVEDSHKTIAQIVEDETEKRVQARLADGSGGDQGGTPPGSQGGDSAGAVTPEQVKAWTMDEMDAYEAEHGVDALRRLLGSVTE